jgi:nicotinamidase-related amidase
MTVNFRLEKSKVCLLIIDVQEKLFAQVERPCEVMQAIQKTARGFQIMDLPIIVSEQYPEGLGSTMTGLKLMLGGKPVFVKKTTFSCLATPDIAEKLMQYEQFVLVGIEAHVCVLQTAKDLLNAGKQVVVLNNAITSRSIYDFSTAIGEIRDSGARISSVETVIFELLHDSKSKEFKQISALIKS